MTKREAIELLLNCYKVESICADSEKAKAENEALDMAIEALHTQPAGWIGVKDKLPEMSGYYLCYDMADRITSLLHYSAYHKLFNAFDEADIVKYSRNVNYWMPMPEPPKENAETEHVKHGWWLLALNNGYSNIRCSVCGYAAYTEGNLRQAQTPFCPNCGARMDGNE